MTNQISIRVSYYLFLTMIVSSFVSFEPAPYDLLMILFIILGLLFSLYKITKEVVFPMVVVCVFLVTNLISLFFVKEIGGAILFTGITFYLALTWMALVALGQQLNEEVNLQLIVKGYLISACVAAVVGILAYFQLVPFSEQMLMYGRAKAFFKDPNVFGPFLVLPALFALSMTEAKKMTVIKKNMYYFLFFILSSGIIISFSRAAWGNYLMSLLIFLLIFKKDYLRKRIRTFVYLFFIGLPIFIYFIQTPLVEDLLVTRLSYKEYDNDRFSTQRAAISTGIINPLGVGAGQSDMVFQYSPHSLYARVFTENGILGLLSVVTLMGLSIIRSFQNYLYSEKEEGVLYLVIFASLMGLVFNSFFVDTLHWRHFWLILAMAWFPGGNSYAGSAKNTSKEMESSL